MKLRFKIDQAEALRQGVDAPKSIVTVTVHPADISDEDRELLANHMNGIDVYKYEVGPNLTYAQDLRRGNSPPPRPFEKRLGCDYIVTELPTYAALVEAIRQNEQEVEAELQQAIDAHQKAVETK